MQNQLALSCLVPLTLLAAACGDEATTTGAGGGGGSDPNDPYTLVPAERLEADPATACPAAFASTAPSAGNNPGFESGGQTRDLFVILPPASFTGPRPLLIGFNGTGETGQSFSDRAKLSELAERGFIVVSPSSVGNGTVWPVWDAMHAPDDPDDANKDLAMFDALVPCIAGHFEVDAKRLYASVERIGNTSITIHVEVYAERGTGREQVVKVTEANLTYVAIDGDGRPRPIVRRGAG